MLREWSQTGTEGGVMIDGSVVIRGAVGVTVMICGVITREFEGGMMVIGGVVVRGFEGVMVLDGGVIM